MRDLDERPERLRSLDAYRGFVMLLMASEGLGIARVAGQECYRDSVGWQAVAYQLSHVKWGGCALWDLIQPSFMFLVGVAMPYSYASRRSRGDSWIGLALHALVRAAVLVALGVMLYSSGSQTNFTFKNVLAQIGLGYFFVFLLLEFGSAVQLIAAVGILVGYWFLFHRHPLPDGEVINQVGILNAVPNYTGYAAHWNVNTNFAAWFDRWFLNLFPREGKPFVVDEYYTLNFVPSMATTLFGVVTGNLLRSYLSKGTKFGLLLAGSIVCFAVSMSLDHTIWPGEKLPQRSDPVPVLDAGPDRPFAERTWTVCPTVKKIWSPTWAVFSTGWTLLFMAGFFLVIDMVGLRAWSFPLVVVGMNSIAMYLLANWIGHVPGGWMYSTLNRHFGGATNAAIGWLRDHLPAGMLPTGDWTPIGQHVVALAGLWLICYWLYRQKAFFRI